MTADRDVLDLVASWAGSDPGDPVEGSPEILNDPWHTAIHEAGHAVVGRVLGLDMGQASVTCDGESAGHSIVGDPWASLARWYGEWRWHREFRSVVCARVVMLMAGAEAEIAIIGALQDFDGQHGDEGDRVEIARVMEHYPGDGAGTPGRLASLRRSARRLVVRHREIIERVAAELRDCGTVPGPDLDAMAPRPASRDPDPDWLALMSAEPGGEPVRIVAPPRIVT